MYEFFPDLFEESVEQLAIKQFGDDIKTRISHGRCVEINPYISKDFKKLREHYTIVLNYCYAIETENKKLKDEKDYYEKYIRLLESNIEKYKQREE